MTTYAEELATKLRYFDERIRKGEKLDAADAGVISAAAERLLDQEVSLASAQDRMSAAASILGRAR